MTVPAPTSPPSGQTRWLRMVPPTLVAGGLAVATAALHLRDPHDQGSWGMCPTAAMGFWCPGCGGLRAVNDLSNARLFDAASSNLLFVLSVPVLAWVFLRWTQGRWTGRTWSASDRALSLSAGVLIAAMAVFTILRNTSAGAWLAP
ncbi:DUF2752 domain-containing protein [Nocardioides caeni]|uniref:DUF2752 domain-containing protein n=1 Tax=Nocardioides caeni TaxID=574700 RepID=A0A4V4HLJ5_9ACTN|nr:DUF2752 domain-containing protein [Nocardioides caeni]THV18576.1 DUF2752 domain-containing protein [Nocardioides caeni]